MVREILDYLPGCSNTGARQVGIGMPTRLCQNTRSPSLHRDAAERGSSDASGKLYREAEFDLDLYAPLLAGSGVTERPGETGLPSKAKVPGPVQIKAGQRVDEKMQEELDEKCK